MSEIPWLVAHGDLFWKVTLCLCAIVELARQLLWRCSWRELPSALRRGLPLSPKTAAYLRERRRRITALGTVLESLETVSDRDAVVLDGKFVAKGKPGEPFPRHRPAAITTLASIDKTKHDLWPEDHVLRRSEQLFLRVGETEHRLEGQIRLIAGSREAFGLSQDGSETRLWRALEDGDRVLARVVADAVPVGGSGYRTHSLTWVLRGNPEITLAYAGEPKLSGARFAPGPARAITRADARKLALRGGRYLVSLLPYLVGMWALGALLLFLSPSPPPIDRDASGLCTPLEIPLSLQLASLFPFHRIDAIEHMAQPLSEMRRCVDERTIVTWSDLEKASGRDYAAVGTLVLHGAYHRAADSGSAIPDFGEPGMIDDVLSLGAVLWRGNRWKQPSEEMWIAEALYALGEVELASQWADRAGGGGPESPLHQYAESHGTLAPRVHLLAGRTLHAADALSRMRVRQEFDVWCREGGGPHCMDLEALSCVEEALRRRAKAGADLGTDEVADAMAADTYSKSGYCAVLGANLLQGEHRQKVLETLRDADALGRPPAASDLLLAKLSAESDAGLLTGPITSLPTGTASTKEGDFLHLPLLELGSLYKAPIVMVRTWIGLDIDLLERSRAVSNGDERFLRSRATLRVAKACLDFLMGDLTSALDELYQARADYFSALGLGISDDEGVYFAERLFVVALEGAMQLEAGDVDQARTHVAHIRSRCERQRRYIDPETNPGFAEKVGAGARRRHLSRIEASEWFASELEALIEYRLEGETATLAQLYHGIGQNMDEGLWKAAAAGDGRQLLDGLKGRSVTTAETYAWLPHITKNKAPLLQAFKWGLRAAPSDATLGQMLVLLGRQRHAAKTLGDRQWEQDLSATLRRYYRHALDRDTALELWALEMAQGQ